MLATRLQTTREKPPLFTIHQSTNNVMGVRLRAREDIKTCVVSFSKHTDAFRIARLIELHRETYKEWPNFNFEENQLDNILRLSGRTHSTDQLNELVIYEWGDIDSLILYCASNFMDLMNMKQIQARGDEGNFKLQGNIHKLNVSEEFARDRLNEILSM